MILTLGKFQSLLAVQSGQLALDILTQINQQANGILVTKQQKAQFLAHAMVESWDFTRLEENLNYSAAALLKTWPLRFLHRPDMVVKCTRNPQATANYCYGGRYGNTAPNDGWLYRGRGIFQITFKNNYADESHAIFKDDRLVTTPSLMVQVPIAVQAALYYYTSRGMDKVSDLVASTKILNGGTNGLDDRLHWYTKFLTVCEDGN